MTKRSRLLAEIILKLVLIFALVATAQYLITDSDAVCRKMIMYRMGCGND